MKLWSVLGTYSYKFCVITEPTGHDFNSDKNCRYLNAFNKINLISATSAFFIKFHNLIFDWL